MSVLEEITKNLTDAAFNQSTPFCYNCYKSAPSGTCSLCHSDDLMCEYKGSVEWGADWIVKQTLEENLSPVDIDSIFEQYIEGIYGDKIEVGFMHFPLVNVMKEHDPISWKEAKSEHVAHLEDSEEIISFYDGSTYYRISDIRNLINKKMEAD